MVRLSKNSGLAELPALGSLGKLREGRSGGTSDRAMPRLVSRMVSAAAGWRAAGSELTASKRRLPKTAGSIV